MKLELHRNSRLLVELLSLKLLFKCLLKLLEVWRVLCLALLNLLFSLNIVPSFS